MSVRTYYPSYGNTQEQCEHGTLHCISVKYGYFFQQHSDSPMPNKSRFTIVITPGTEKLASDSSELRQREGPTLSKGIVSLSQLAASLANQPYPDREISYG